MVQFLKRKKFVAQLDKVLLLAHTNIKYSLPKAILIHFPESSISFLECHMANRPGKECCVKIGFITVPNSFTKGFEIYIFLQEEEIGKCVKPSFISTCFFYLTLNIFMVETTKIQKNMNQVRGRRKKKINKRYNNEIETGLRKSYATKDTKHIINRKQANDLNE